MLVREGEGEGRVFWRVDVEGNGVFFILLEFNAGVDEAAAAPHISGVGSGYFNVGIVSVICGPNASRSSVETACQLIGDIERAGVLVFRDLGDLNLRDGDGVVLRGEDHEPEPAFVCFRDLEFDFLHSGGLYERFCISSFVPLFVLKIDFEVIPCCLRSDGECGAVFLALDHLDAGFDEAASVILVTVGVSDGKGRGVRIVSKRSRDLNRLAFAVVDRFDFEVLWMSVSFRRQFLHEDVRDVDDVGVSAGLNSEPKGSGVRVGDFELLGVGVDRIEEANAGRIPLLVLEKDLESAFRIVDRDGELYFVFLPFDELDAGIDESAGIVNLGGFGCDREIGGVAIVGIRDAAGCWGIKARNDHILAR